MTSTSTHVLEALMHSLARRPATYVVALLVMAVAAALGTANANASPQAQADGGTAAKVGRFHFEHWATLSRIPGGYYYDAGQQNTHLVVTRVKGGLRYADRHTDVLRSKPDSCHRKHAKVGLVVVCHVPSGVTASSPLQVKVFTRLGDDYVDTSQLPAAFDLYGLADAGDDTYIGGAADDFINGAPGRDRLVGGGGNDWLRAGEDHDVILGGPGNDRLVGVYGPDRIVGGSGQDRLGGGPGDDTLYAGPQDDFVLCNSGHDWVSAQKADRITSDCENIHFS
jgi:Ca2+-binding RTX toxin-like protein